MEIYFLNSDFKDMHALDSFKSLIWTDRYWRCGSLDLVLDPRNDLLEMLTSTAYFRIAESDHKMVLDSYSVETDRKDGNKLIVQGRSLSSILDRRIVWDAMNLSGNLQTELQRLVSDNVINTGVTARNMPFSFPSSTDPAITALTIDSQWVGETVYKVLTEVCQTNGIGFTVVYLEDTSLFELSLYAGVDRSYGQTDETSVAFTTTLGNLVNSNYVDTLKHFKTVCLVAGEEGIENARTTVTVAISGSPTGLNRRETYLEANINRSSPDGDLSEAEYLLQLEGKGVEDLAKKVHIQAFDGEVDTIMYNYGEEFFMGDILQIADDYGHKTESRVIEMIYSQNEEGTKIYPTFQTIEG